VTVRRKVVRVKNVLDHPYFHLDLATERDAKGHEHTYILGTGPDIAFTVPLWDDGTVTLNAQRRFGMKEPSIEVPGGHVDRGEKPLAGAQQRVHLYLAEGLTPGPQELDHDEEIVLVRLPFEDALSRARRGWMVHGPSILALYAAAEHVRTRR
jgi:ADP-ribose pyrophosphatase